MTITTASPIAPLLHTDGYKVGHYVMMPQADPAAGKTGTTRIYSNFTNRGTRIPGVTKVVHFGLQAYLQKFLVEEFAPFFAADEDEVARLYQEAMDSYLGPDMVDVDHIRALHRLGYLPLRFCAMPEGTRVPLRVPTFTIENTHPDFAWVTNYIESALSASVWHASTTATIANEFRDILEAGDADTGGDGTGIDFQAHDFSFRGQTSIESASASAAAHLLSFLGTDGLPALDWIRRYYPGDNGLVAASVPATEHSVMCAGGQDTELQTYDRLLDTFPKGVLSVVSDTWSLWRVLTEFLPQLKEKILARDGKLVIRPDSGNPADILCGTQIPESIGMAHHYPARDRDPHERGSVEERGVVQLLWDEFGGTINEAGYKVLDPHIGAIYGDSITRDRAKEIIRRLKHAGFASSNVVFGIGSYSYQGVTRDTFNSAVKATWAEIDGQPVNLLKDPVTDSGMKKSATGRLAVTRGADGELELTEDADPAQEANSLLQPIWENGEPLVTQSFADVRATLQSERG